MKKKLVMVLMTLTLAACGYVGGDREIPAKFKTQFQTYQTENGKLNEQIASLNKELAEVQVKLNYNLQQENALGGQVLQELGLHNEEFTVDVVKMKVVKRPVYR